MPSTLSAGKAGFTVSSGSSSEPEHEEDDVEPSEHDDGHGDDWDDVDVGEDEDGLLVELESSCS